MLEMLKQEFGAELLVADEIGKRLMEPDGACFRPVAELFGREILTETGGLDRKKIAELVFQDRDRLTALNQIIHPAVRAEIEKRLSDLERTERRRLSLNRPFFWRPVMKKSAVRSGIFMRTVRPGSGGWRRAGAIPGKNAWRL